MDLLETILRKCNAEKHLDSFKKNNVDTYALKLLNSDDLKYLGINDEEMRTSLLKYISNLQIPAEKNIQRDINAKYIQLVLNQMSIQLYKHFANLSCAVHRTDIELCSIQLTPGVECLRNCIKSLEATVLEFKNISDSTNPKREKNLPILPIITTVACFCAGLYLTRYVISLKLP